MQVTERRLVIQDWYETELNKNGWDSNGWEFKDSGGSALYNKWNVVEILQSDKYGNPILGVAEKETEIN